MTRLMKRLPPLLLQTMLRIHQNILKRPSSLRAQSHSLIIEKFRRSCLELATVISIVSFRILP
jgi:hypothetical protein